MKALSVNRAHKPRHGTRVRGGTHGLQRRLTNASYGTIWCVFRAIENPALLAGSRDQDGVTRRRLGISGGCGVRGHPVLRGDASRENFQIHDRVIEGDRRSCYGRKSESKLRPFWNVIKTGARLKRCD